MWMLSGLVQTSTQVKSTVAESVSSTSSFGSTAIQVDFRTEVDLGAQLYCT